MGITADRAIWEAESNDFELLHITIGDLVDQQAAVLPDKEALVYHYPERELEMRLTYRSLRDEVNRVASAASPLMMLRRSSIRAVRPVTLREPSSPMQAISIAPTCLPREQASRAAIAWCQRCRSSTLPGVSEVCSQCWSRAAR